MKNKLYRKYLLLFAFVFLAVLSAGCSKKQAVQGFQDTYYAQYGEWFTLPMADEWTVTDSEGKAIPIEAECIFIEQAEYNLTLSKNGNKSTSKILAVNHRAPRIITPIEMAYGAKGTKVELCTATASDGVKQIDVEYKMYFGEKEINITNGFVPTQTGEYTYVIRAKGEGAVAEKKIPYYIEENEAAYKDKISSFDKPYGVEQVAATYAHMEYSDKIKFDNEEGSLRLDYNVSGSGLSSETMYSNMNQEDITGYDGIYFYAYNDSDVSFSTHLNNWDNTTVLAPKTWTRVQIDRESYESVFANYYSGGNDICSPENINGFLMVVEIGTGDLVLRGDSVYFSSIRGINEVSASELNEMCASLMKRGAITLKEYDNITWCYEKLSKEEQKKVTNYKAFRRKYIKDQYGLEKNTALAFGTEYGLNQILPQDTSLNNYRFTTDKHYGEEPGSLKVSQKKYANGGMVLHFQNSLDIEYGENKYLLMQVYYEGDSEDMQLWFTKTNSKGWGWNGEDRASIPYNLKPNAWTSVILPLEGIQSLNDYGVLCAIMPPNSDWYLTEDDVLYFSNAIVKDVPSGVVIAAEDPFGETQIQGDWNDGRAQIKHTVAKAYGKEEGSIRITQLVQGEDGWGKEILLHFNNPLNEKKNFKGYKDNEYLKFQIWYESEKTVTNMKVTLSHTAGKNYGWGKDIKQETAVTLTPNKWTTVYLPLKGVKSLEDYGMLITADWQNFKGDTFYISNAVIEEDSEIASDAALAYSNIYGLRQIQAQWNDGRASIEYAEDKAYANESGSLKITQIAQGKEGYGKELLLRMQKPLNEGKKFAGYKKGQYLKFAVWYEGDSTVDNMEIALSHIAGKSYGWGSDIKRDTAVTLTPNAWTTVYLPLEGVKTIEDYGLFITADWQNFKGDTFYISNAVIEEDSEIASDAALAYSNIYGLRQIQAQWNDGRASIEYAEDKAYANESGSLKITQIAQGKEGYGKELLLRMQKPLNEGKKFAGYKKGQYLKFAVWYEGDSTVDNMEIALSHIAGKSYGWGSDIKRDTAVTLTPNAWTTVYLPLEGVKTIEDYGLFITANWQNFKDDTFYISNAVVADAGTMAKNTALAYSNSYGLIQVQAQWNDGRASIEYAEDKAYANESGSLKVTQINQGQEGYGKELLLKMKNPLGEGEKFAGYKKGQYLKFAVWYEGDSTVDNMEIALSYVAGKSYGWGSDIKRDTAVTLTPNAWTIVYLPLENVKTLSDYGLFITADWQNFKGDTFYISNAVIEEDSEIASDAALAYSNIYGLRQIQAQWNDGRASIEYAEDKAYANESGSLKITQIAQGKEGYGKELLLKMKNPLNEGEKFAGYKKNQYLKFQVWYEGKNSVQNMSVTLSHIAGESFGWGKDIKAKTAVVLTPNAWTTVYLPLEDVKTLDDYGLFITAGWKNYEGDVFYLSNASIENIEIEIGEDVVYASSNVLMKSFVSEGVVSHSNEMKYGDEEGSTKVFYSESGVLFRPEFINQQRKLDGSETLEFYVYYTGNDTKHLNLYGMRAGVSEHLKYINNIKKNEWVKVEVYLQGCTSLDCLLLENGDWGQTSMAGDTLYISDVKVSSKDAVVYGFGTGESSFDNPYDYKNSASYTTEKAYGTEQGSLKVVNDGNPNESLFALPKQLISLSGAEVLEMYVYYAPAESNSLEDMYFYLSEGAYDKDGSTPALLTKELKKNEWTKVTIDLTQLGKKSVKDLYVKLMSNRWGGCVGDTWYVSSLKVVKSNSYTLETGLWSELASEGGAAHPQGIAYDDDNKYMYVSYTTFIVKVDMQTGDIVGRVKGFKQSSVMKDIHLGDMTYYDGKIYEACLVNNRFYIAVFDCDKINGEVHYQDAGVMKALYLSQVTETFTKPLYDAGGSTIRGAGSRYWWDGCDGITFGKLPGGGYDTDGDGKVDVKDDKMYLLHTNSACKNPSVYDNENFFIQVFDPADINESNLLPFTDARVQAAVTKSEEFRYKFKTFVYVGNSDYGVQTMAYDKDTGDLWMETYGKPAGTEFPKYGRYVIDGSVPLYMAEVEVGQSVTGDASGFISQEEAHRIAALYKDYEDGDGDGDYEEQEQGWHMTLKCLCEKGGLENHKAVVYGATGHACKICGGQATFSCGIAYAGNGHFYGVTNYTRVLENFTHHGAAVSLYKWNQSNKNLKKVYSLFAPEKETAPESIIVYGFGTGESDLSNPFKYANSTQYVTEKAYGTEEGSLKITNDGNSNESLLSLIGQLHTLTGNEKLEMYVYYAPAKDNNLDNMHIYLSVGEWDTNNALLKTQLKKNEWTKVTIDLAKINKTKLDGLYIKLMSEQWGGFVGDAWYFSNIKVVQEKE